MNIRTSALLLAALSCLATFTTANAVVVIDTGEIQRLSHINTTVTPTGNGTYLYQYTVVNDSPSQQWVNEMEVWPLIVGYEIPLDSESIINNIQSAETWSYRFLSNAEYISQYGANPFNSAWVLQWYDAQWAANRAIAPTGFNARFEANEYEPSASGFSFESALAPKDGPYANLWADMLRNIGDPPLPGGMITGGGLPYTPLSMPDGGATVSLLGFVFVGLALLGRRIRR